MKKTILTIISFIGFSVTAFAQDKKMDSLYSDFEGSVMSSSGNISEKYNNGYIFSMKIVVSPDGNVKSLTISDNIEKGLAKDYLLKNKSRLNLDYFKALAKFDKLKADAIYIVPVMCLNEAHKAKIEVDDLSKLTDIFRYDNLKDNMKNITILRPCAWTVSTIIN